MKNKTLHNDEPRYALLLIQILVTGVLLGRAWQHIFWDAPFRVLLWDESLLKPLVERIFNIPWNRYATSPSVDAFIQMAIKVQGWVYLLAIVSVWKVREDRKWIVYVLWYLSISLTLLSFLQAKDRFYQFAMFFEHSSQMMSPLLLWIWVFKKDKRQQMLFFAKILVALTFICHGLYAFGWPFPRPGAWSDMLINIFGISSSLAGKSLYWIGIVDFAAAGALFVPVMRKYALWYCIIWGALTSWARIVSPWDIHFAIDTLHQHFYKVILRAPHGFLPMYILYYEFWAQRKCLHKCAMVQERPLSCLHCAKAWKYALREKY
jgi:hypothetical protein